MTGAVGSGMLPAYHPQQMQTQYSSRAVYGQNFAGGVSLFPTPRVPDATYAQAAVTSATAYGPYGVQDGGYNAWQAQQHQSSQQQLPQQQQPHSQPELGIPQ